VSLEKVCVILGAGASLDVAGPGAPIKNLSLRLPLAIDLFDIKKHDAYWSIDLPPKKESSYNVSLKGLQRGRNGQKELQSGLDHQGDFVFSGVD
jgi:hypothetical protein